MAENEISDYAETDNDNTDIAGISVQENVMRPPAVNNAFRALQGALKRWFKSSLFRLRDGTDQTKLLAFDLSALPTGTTKTMAVPASGQFTDWLGVPQGRLSLASGTVLPTSDITGATTIYYVAALGTKVPIWDGTQMRARDFGSQVAFVLDSNTAHSGYQVANVNHDIWAIWDSGQVRVGSGPQWTAGPVPGSDTVRGSGSAGTTELELVSGIYVNKNDIQVRYGAGAGDIVTVPARRATLLGTFRPTAHGQATDTTTRRLLANAHNQAARLYTEVKDTTVSWTYSTAALRRANNNTNTKAELLFALNGAALQGRMFTQVVSSTATFRVVGAEIYLDGARATDAFTYVQVNDPEVRKFYTFMDSVVSAGFHTVELYEYGGGADTQTWTGNTQRLKGVIFN